MNINFISGLITGLCLFGIVSISHATPLLNIVEGSPSISGTLPLNGTHDVLETKGAVGWYNANLFALENITLTYEYLGFEAGWTNAFLVDNNIAFQNKAFGGFSASVVGDTVFSSETAGSLLDFAFAILVGGNAGNGVENGSNVEPMGTPSLIMGTVRLTFS